MHVRRRSGLVALVCALAASAAAAGVRSVPSGASGREGPGSGGAPTGEGPIPFDPAVLPAFPPWTVEYALTVILVGGTLVVALYLLIVLYQDGLAGLLEVLVTYVRTIVVAAVVGLVLAAPLFLGMDLTSAIPDVPTLTGGQGEESGSAGGGADATGGLPGWILPIAVLVVLAGASLVAYRAYVNAIADDDRGGGGGSRRSPAEPSSGGESHDAVAIDDVDAANDVYRAWAALADEVLPAHRRTATPAEVAGAAREAELDPEAVAALTDVFEEIRYGGRDVTTDRERRATEAATALDLEVMVA